jgi:hypothetical protein
MPNFRITSPTQTRHPGYRREQIPRSYTTHTQLQNQKHGILENPRMLYDNVPPALENKYDTQPLAEPVSS